MNLPWETISGFAGATGVGALILLGVYLIVDGWSPHTYPTVEFYAKTATWGIVAAVPVLTISYVLGLLAIGAAQWLSQKTGMSSVNDAADIAKIAVVQSPATIQRYFQLRQDQEILSGSGIAFIMLALGALVDSHNLPDLRKVTYASALGAILVAFGCFGLSISKGNVAHAVANAQYQLPPTKQQPPP